MIKKADFDLKRAQRKVESMEKMLVDAQEDIDKSKEMFQSATSEVKQIDSKMFRTN